MRPGAEGLPRSFAPGIQWLGGCVEAFEPGGTVVHIHASAYLIDGGDESLLVDTGHPSEWAAVAKQLDSVLGDRPLDWVFPTHPELAHAGNLARLLRKYPASRVTGDVRDYHLHLPDVDAKRFVHRKPGEDIDLGRGYRVVFLQALIKDAPSSEWAFEVSQRVLFVADGFSYTHYGVVDDQPVHRPGECALMSTELPSPPSAEQASYITRAALYWTRFVDVTPIFRRVNEMLEEYPAHFIAPAHGNVIGNVEQIMPTILRAHQLAYQQ